VLVASHVFLERLTVAPPADHQDLAGITVRLPNLQINEAASLVDESRARPKRGDQLGRALGRNG